MWDRFHRYLFIKRAKRGWPVQSDFKVTETPFGSELYKLEEATIGVSTKKIATRASLKDLNSMKVRKWLG